MSIINDRNFIGVRNEPIDAHNLPVAELTARDQAELFDANPGLSTMNLGQVIEILPQYLPQDDVTPLPMMRSWTASLPLRYQGVILTAIRGCDGAPKHDPSKKLMTMIRRSCCNPADSRETNYAKGFMGLDKSMLYPAMQEFFGSMDQYPFHFIMHVLHACEVIGYCHPNTVVSCFFQLVYAEMCFRMHLNRETKEQLHTRLTLDRVAAGTVEV